MIYFRIFCVVFFDILALYMLFDAIYVLFFGAPAISSSFETEEKLARLIGKLSKKRDFVFMDLGCGNGKIILKLAKKFDKAFFIGVEVNPVVCFYCKLKKFLLKRKNILFIRKNIFKLDVKKYKPDFIYLYLGEGLSLKFSKKLEKQVSLNTYVISNKFELSSLKLTDIVKYNSLINGPLRIYQKRRK